MKATTTAIILREAIKAVLPAMSTDRTRVALNCVNLSFDSKASRATACDGHWMAVHEIECSVQTPGAAGVAPPFLGKLLSALDGLDGQRVGIASQRDKIQFTVEGFGTIAATAIHNCPPYEKVWPSGNPKPVPQMGVDAVLLGRLTKAFPNGRRRAPLKIEFYGELDPIVVTASGTQMKAIIMPCRVG